MEEEPPAGTVEQLADSVRRTEAIALANRYVLREILRDLADSARNRHAFLADMFDRIGAQADRLPIESRSDPAIVGGLFREELAKFFAEVARRPTGADGERDGVARR